MSTKDFYDRNVAFVEEVLDVERAHADINTPGKRYNCVASELTDAGSLRAVELGFGSKMRARYFASLFGEFEAAYLRLEDESLEWLLDLGEQLVYFKIKCLHLTEI